MMLELVYRKNDPCWTKYLSSSADTQMPEYVSHICVPGISLFLSRCCALRSSHGSDLCLMAQTPCQIYWLKLGSLQRLPKNLKPWVILEWKEHQFMVGQTLPLPELGFSENTSENLELTSALWQREHCGEPSFSEFANIYIETVSIHA